MPGTTRWAEKFLSRFEEDPNGCWLWTGHLNATGYGVMFVNGVRYTAHRLSYALHNGDLPADSFICHHCDVPACVNPVHLYAGDAATNVRDMVERGRARGPRSEDAGSVKLSPEAVRAIRADYATGRYTQKELARKYGTVQANIWQIVNRLTWQEVA